MRKTMSSLLCASFISRKYDKQGDTTARCGSGNGTSKIAHKYHHYTLHQDNYDDVFSSWYVVGVYFLK